jgi:hypothetical protein
VISESSATLHLAAAAATSIVRAAAPAVRSGAKRPMMLPLPPVPRRVKSGPGEACSMRIDSSGASSSSARIIGSAVRTPCPISLLPIFTTIVPSASMRNQAFGLKVFGASCAELVRTPRTSAPALPAMTLRNVRRFAFTVRPRS